MSNPSFATEVKVLVEIAEMKRIFSAIETSFLKSNPACLVVTSAMRGEGKTIIVSALAAIAALQGKKRVLAVDFNWHAPALHTSFGLDLIEVEKFKNRVSIEDLAQNSGINHLDILTAIQSSTNEGELYENKNVIAAEIIRQARDAYDFTFIDTSRIFPTNRYMMDPVTISKTADGVALLVLANVTPRQEVKRARTILETAGAKVLGVIVNQWKNPIA